MMNDISSLFSFLAGHPWSAAFFAICLLGVLQIGYRIGLEKGQRVSDKAFEVAFAPDALKAENKKPRYPEIPGLDSF